MDTAKSELRPDFANVFENELWSENGFNVRIPAKDIPEGELTLQILIENNGELCSRAPFTLVRNGYEIQR